MKILSKELVELKHKVLQQRIIETLNSLKMMDKLIACPKDIKSIEIISDQYEKMYQTILTSGEYSKYEEIENTITEHLSMIEARLDRNIYKISSQYPKYFEAIEESENYKNFRNLDIELEKLHSLKSFLVRCRPYHSKKQQSDLKSKIMDLRFNVLVRRQVEQMIYENQATTSRLNQYEDGEQEYFTSRVKEMIMRVKDKDDTILLSYDVQQIMKANILTNHLIFKVLQQDIEANPQKYMGLLDAKIFNPHLCNIANNPFEGNIPYAKAASGNYINFFEKDPDKIYLKRSNANLLLLRSVLEYVIGNENTTIVECSDIYSRFGFECRPIVFCEGQELIRILFSKVKDNIKPKQKDISKTNGRYCLIYIGASTYEFNPKEERFFTNAELLQLLKNKSGEIGTLIFDAYYFGEQDGLLKQEFTLKGMETIINKRSKILEHITGIEENDWVRLPLLKVHKPFKNVKVPIHRSHRSIHRAHEWETRVTEISDYRPLWMAYKSDFEKLGIKVKMKELPKGRVTNYIAEERLRERTYRREESGWGRSFCACINLDDIADLPIDFEKIYILTEEDMKNVQKIEEREQKEDER